MTEGTAIDIAKWKMEELGIEDYILRYRQFRIGDRQTRKIKAHNQYFVLARELGVARIISKMGIYQLGDSSLNELQFIHSGVITIENLFVNDIDIKFIQAIPKVKRRRPRNIKRNK